MYATAIAASLLQVRTSLVRTIAAVMTGAPIVMSGALVGCIATSALGAQVVELQVETPVSFDSRGRVPILLPRTATAVIKDIPWWPLKAGEWREARLYTLSTALPEISPRTSEAGRVVAVLVVVGNSGAVSRYGFSQAGLDQVRVLFDGGVAPTGADDSRPRSGVELSQPAGNTFVRNQTFLGLVAYGPATAAILSKNGASATGGYFLAAGSSFFIAARMIRTRSVTRSQTILGTHAGLRGGAAGAAVAAIMNEDDGSGFGVPILIGAIGGTVGGFAAARNMSDGEAASSGLGADMFALTTLGTSIALNAFDTDSSERNMKIALGTAVGTAALGYFVGPNYARRSSYNVTAGDASVAFTGALIGGAAGAAITNSESNGRAAAGLATAGLITGFVLSDRFLVRRYDRSSSDAAWAKLGAGAGALMGAGVAIAAKAQLQGGLGLTATGGMLGLIAADRMINPAADAGALRGVMRTGALSPHAEGRVQLSLPAAATALVLWNGQRQQENKRAGSAKRGGAIQNFPALRVTF
ncbi:MAG: hypothetical protein H7Z40_19775 [Phycisphaerae bacterium]|nr:hypothetical protein [Gemmatimonadaceae bacterium]